MLKKKPRKKNLLFIHGAWSSSVCFSYLNSKLMWTTGLGQVLNLEYNTQVHSVPKAVAIGRTLIEGLEDPTIIIGHSMGGVIGLGLHDEHNVDSIITIAAPLSGISLNRFLRSAILYRTPNLDDVFCGSAYLNKLHSATYHKPVNCVITTFGYNPGIFEKNDGVVTVRSQTEWLPSTATSHEVALNHHDVLQSDLVVELIRSRILA